MRVLRHIWLLVFIHCSTGYAGVQHEIYQIETPKCLLSASHDAVPNQAGVLVIRVANHGSNTCDAEDHHLTALIDRALHSLATFTHLAPIESIYLGRLIYYPWLSKHLMTQAANSKQWDHTRGRPINVNINQYVNYSLHKSPWLGSVKTMLESHSIKVTDVSCEKVLINQDKLPYDAMCWLVVEK